MRGLSLTRTLAALVLLAGGVRSTASGQIVVRRLPAAAGDVAPAADARRSRPSVRGSGAPQPARVRATLPPALEPSGANAGPAVWRHEMEVRAQRWRAIPHVLSRPGFDWSPRAMRRRGWRAPASLRNPHGAEAAQAAAFGPPDTVRIAFLRIDFLNDRGGPLSSGDGKFDLSGPDPNAAPIDRPPHNRAFYLAHLEALRRYYDVMTYGRVVIEGDVWPRTPNGAYSLHDMADFGPWAFSQDIYGAAVDFMRSAFFAADSQAKVAFQDTIPWDRYDRFMIIHAGSDLQSDLKQDSPEDIPTFTIGVPARDAIVFPDSTNRPIDRTTIVPETANQDGFFGALNGLIAHENGHNLFGFADLYDIFTGRPVVGYWSLMDSGNLVGAPFLMPDGTESFAVGLLPPSVDPFHRFFISDVLPFTDVVDDTMTIADSERNPDLRRLFLSSDEYLILENRALAASDSVPLDQDTTTRVILGPKFPDRFEYDALLPSIPHAKGTPPPASGGILVWHIDASTIPFETALRIDPATDYGFNSGPGPPAITVVEADGLADLGDPSSPFLFGSPYDPWFRSNNRTLADDTEPDLRPHTGSRPHARLDFLDDPGMSMRVVARHEWRLPGWPVLADFPPGGPELLAVDADGVRGLEVCWAGGAEGSPDSTALFAVRADGTGLFGSSLVFATLDHRPRPLMAALPVGDPLADPPQGPSYFAVSTDYDASADTLGGSPGGQVWLIDHTGTPLPGWPASLPSPVTTPPVISGIYPNAIVWVGCLNGRVYGLDLTGRIVGNSEAGLPGGISGRLAVTTAPPGFVTPAGDPVDLLVAAGSAEGAVEVLGLRNGTASLVSSGLLLASPGGAGFEPDFLWIGFGGNGAATGAGTCGPAVPTLIVHHADRLWAYCPNGAALPGWGRALGDTLVAGLGAGDPDGDGFPEVLTQSVHSQVAFWNESGYPSPGWPRAATREGLRTGSPALAMDVNGDHRSEIVTLDGSGLLVALQSDGRNAPGWPLATGAGALGAPVIADLDRDGSLEIVAPDRFVPDSLRGDVNGRFATLYAFSLPPAVPDQVANAWPMVGGDAGRTSALPASRAPTAGPATSGPLVGGSLHAFPNPARRRPVSFAFQLSEPAEVDFSILDSSGHEVASFTRPGRRADNLEVWDPGRVPAGLYLARLRFRGATSTTSQVLTLGLLR